MACVLEAGDSCPKAAEDGGMTFRFSRAAVIGALVGLAACGGGGRGSVTGNTGGSDVVWPDRDGGTSTELPAIVQVGRIVFESESGESCCIAVDPTLLSGEGSPGLAVLDDLPAGPATVTVAGYTTDFAPAAPGVSGDCTAIPAAAARPCDTTRVATAAFQSDPLSVNIIAGAQTNLGQVTMKALPFLIDFEPAQNELSPLPVGFDFTIVDAVTNVRGDSVGLEVSFELEAETVEVPPPAPTPARPSFRLISKRIPIQLSACADDSETPCTSDGLGLSGFKATGSSMNLPAGPIEAHIVAENDGDPPQGLDFRYPFSVEVTPTPGSGS